MIEGDFEMSQQLVVCVGQSEKTWSTSCYGAPRAYTQERIKCERLQQPYPEEEDDVTGQYLFKNKLIEETKSMSEGKIPTHRRHGGD